MRRSWMLVMFAACGGGGTASAVQGQAASAGSDAPPWSALFEEGRRWEFEVEQIGIFAGAEADRVELDIPRESVVARATMTCTVAAVEARGGAQLAEVRCEAHPLDGNESFNPEQDLGPAGIWISAPDGLWRRPTLESARAFVDAGRALREQLLAWPAVAHAGPANSSVKGWADDASVAAGEVEVQQRVEQDASGAWCLTEAVIDGGSTYLTDCLSAEAGFVGGNWGTDAGGERVEEYRYAPRGAAAASP